MAQEAASGGGGEDIADIDIFDRDNWDRPSWDFNEPIEENLLQSIYGNTTEYNPPSRNTSDDISKVGNDGISRVPVETIAYTLSDIYNGINPNAGPIAKGIAKAGNITTAAEYVKSAFNFMDAKPNTPQQTNAGLDLAANAATAPVIIGIGAAAGPYAASVATTPLGAAAIAIGLVGFGVAYSMGVTWALDTMKIDTQSDSSVAELKRFD